MNWILPSKGEDGKIRSVSLSFYFLLIPFQSFVLFVFPQALWRTGIHKSSLFVLGRKKKRYTPRAVSDISKMRKANLMKMHAQLWLLKKFTKENYQFKLDMSTGPSFAIFTIVWPKRLYLSPSLQIKVTELARKATWSLFFLWYLYFLFALLNLSRVTIPI